MKLLAIDPGNEQSAWVLYDTETRKPVAFGKEANEVVEERVACRASLNDTALVVEMVASYGMAVGREVFETCVFIGQLMATWRFNRSFNAPHAARLVRRDVKMHLCGNNAAKDANIRQALIDRYGPGKEKAVGVKAKPGPLYGVKADVWQALALAVTYADTRLPAPDANAEK